MSRSPPPSLGPYRLSEHLGSGGTSEVYCAYDVRLEREVALKRIRSDASLAPEARDRLLLEARAAARLNHPNLVQVHDILETEDGDWLVLEWVDGRPLAQWLEHGALDIDSALGTALEIAAGLAAAHAVGILHGDLKTENVVIAAGGRAKILDFGLASSLDEAEAPSGNGTIRGTPRAMAPEAILGERLGPPSDLFSLGVLLYEMLAGRSPFLGPGPVETLARVLHEPPDPLRDHVPDAPPELCVLVDRLLAKDPSHRPATADEVLATLGALVQSRPPAGTSVLMDPENENETFDSLLFDSELAESDPGGPGFRPSGLERQVSVLCCCLASADASEALDPEALFEVLPEFQGTVSGIVDRRRGHLVHLQGHRWTVAFGYPRAHEEGVASAVRSALEVIDRIDASPTAQRHGVRARAGLHVGSAVEIEESDGGRRLILGPTLDRARELEEGAEPGAVVIDRATRSRLADEFDLGSTASAELLRVIAPRDPFSWPSEPSLRMVGRRSELRLLDAAIDDLREGRGRALWLHGETGVGKTRLAVACRDSAQRRGRADDARWIYLRVAPGHGIQPPVVGRLLLRALIGAPLLESSQSARETLARALATHSAFADELSEALDPWLDLASEEAARDTDAMRRNEALLAWLCEMADRRPIVLVIEDLDRAGSHSFELVAELAVRTSTAPIVLLVTTHPEIGAPRRRDLPASRLPLAPLDREESAELLEALTPAGTKLDGASREELLRRADGLPGHLVALYRARDRGEVAAVPLDLWDRFASRLDRLGSARDVAQVAAIPARPSRQLLATLLEMDPVELGRELDRLVEAGVLETDGPEAFRFRRVLMRDLAWASMVDEDRERLLPLVEEK